MLPEVLSQEIFLSSSSVFPEYSAYLSLLHHENTSLISYLRALIFKGSKAPDNNSRLISIHHDNSSHCSRSDLIGPLIRRSFKLTVFSYHNLLRLPDHESLHLNIQEIGIQAHQFVDIPEEKSDILIQLLHRHRKINHKIDSIFNLD